MEALRRPTAPQKEVHRPQQRADRQPNADAQRTLAPFSDAQKGDFLLSEVRKGRKNRQRGRQGQQEAPDCGQESLVNECVSQAGEQRKTRRKHALLPIGHAVPCKQCTGEEERPELQKQPHALRSP